MKQCQEEIPLKKKNYPPPTPLYVRWLISFVPFIYRKRDVLYMVSWTVNEKNTSSFSVDNLSLSSFSSVFRKFSRSFLW